MADGARGRAAPGTTGEVRSEDWGGQDLSGQRFEAVLLVDVDLSEVTATGAAFTDCTFRGARLNVSAWTQSAFTGCTFVRCNLFDARFTDCKLVGSTFESCSLDLLRVSGGDWSYVGLSGADLRSATLDGLRMREADLRGARLQAATLTDCDLSGASWDKADLSRCDLRGSDLSALDPATVQLRGAVIDPQQAMLLAVAMGLDVRDSVER